jgi:hypothetical protein
MEQVQQNKETKNEKCSCTKRIVALEKQVAELKREISLLRGVIKCNR